MMIGECPVSDDAGSEMAHVLDEPHRLTDGTKDGDPASFESLRRHPLFGARIEESGHFSVSVEHRFIAGQRLDTHSEPRLIEGTISVRDHNGAGARHLTERFP